MPGKRTHSRGQHVPCLVASAAQPQGGTAGKGTHTGSPRGTSLTLVNGRTPVPTRLLTRPVPEGTAHPDDGLRLGQGG